MITDAESYIEGLLVGRGRLYRDQRRILIEFPHKNPTLPGIAHCPKCGWLATGFKQLKCKNPKCKSSVDQSAKRIYEQQVDTKESLANEVIPFISESIDCKMKVSPGSYSTHLFIDFPENSDTWRTITNDFPEGKSHYDFHLPWNLSGRSLQSKIEFTNGMLDTAGFVNSGGWLPRDGANGHGRMRLYFQIVRNWPLVVEIDNFLRREFKLPIQNIDWGHPNIRTGAGLEGATSSTTREHQIKIFPEYMEDFNFRIACKRRLFQELLQHNKSVGFEQKEDWFPPRNIPDSQRKPIHPSEGDLRLPVQVRRHFDAFWQINLALGCDYLEQLSSESKNSNVFALTGDINSDEEFDALQRRLEALYEERKLIDVSIDEETHSQKTVVKSSPEFATYGPLRDWLESYLRNTYDKSSVAWITADQNLTNFLKGIEHDALALVENLSDLRIRPDIVGFLPSTGELVFVESKVTPLNLREVGQLLGYCLVAQPKRAFLISTKKVDVHLKALIKEHPDLIDYGCEEKIQLLHFDTQQMKQPDGE